MDSDDKNLDEYNVTLVDKNDIKIPKKYKCSFFYLLIMAFITFITGLFTTGFSLYIYSDNIDDTINITEGVNLLLVILGAAFTLMSIFLWISSCNYTHIFAKTVLSVFSIFSFCMFLASSITTIYSCVYFGNNGLNNCTEMDSILNNTIHYTYDICCDDKNSTSVLKDICYDITNILGNNESKLEYDCRSFKQFELDFVAYIHHIFIWLLGISGFVALVSLTSGITSCCLIFAHKRIFYYKYFEAVV